MSRMFGGHGGSSSKKGERSGQSSTGQALNDAQRSKMLDPKFKTQIQEYLERCEARKQAHSAEPGSQRGIEGARADDLNRDNEAAQQDARGGGRPMAQDVIFGQRGGEQAGLDGDGPPQIKINKSSAVGEQSSFQYPGQGGEPREMADE